MTAQACVRGCTVPGKHKTTCRCADVGHRHVIEWHDHVPDAECSADCRGCDWCDGGCLPRPARVGLLCAGDAGRIVRTVAELPALVMWIRVNVTPGGAGSRDVLREAPAPLDVQAVDDADRLHRLLCEWAARYLADAGLAGPKHVASLVRPGGHASLHAGATGEATGELAAWLTPHLAGMAAQPWAGRWHDRLTATVRQVDQRWPREDARIKLPLPCPTCQRVMLYRHPPVTKGADFTVICHADDCDRVLSLDDYYVRAHVALGEHRQKAMVR